MKLWTPEHEEMLTELVTRKKDAEAALADDIEKFSQNGDVAVSMGHVNIIDLLTKRGQAVLDMLLRHYDPSPVVVVPEPVPPCPTYETPLPETGTWPVEELERPTIVRSHRRGPIATK